MCEGVVDRQVQGDVDTEKVVLLYILTLRRVLLCIEQDGGGYEERCDRPHPTKRSEPWWWHNGLEWGEPDILS